MIILIFLLFFFVGFLKQVLAGWPGECTQVQYKINGTYVAPSDNYGYWAGSWEITSAGYVVTSGSWSGIDTGETGYSVNVWTNYYENGSWIGGGIVSVSVRELGEGTEVSDLTLPEGECPNDCEDEKAAKRTECGGDQYVDWSTWNDETCTGAECLVDKQLNIGSPEICE